MVDEGPNKEKRKHQIIVKIVGDHKEGRSSGIIRIVSALEGSSKWPTPFLADLFLQVLWQQ